MASSQGIDRPPVVEHDVAKAQTKASDASRRQSGDDLEQAKMGAIVVDSELTSGIARAEAMQLVWGKHGRVVVWCGIAMMLIV